MKRIITFVLSILMTIALWGCGNAKPAGTSAYESSKNSISTSTTSSKASQSTAGSQKVRYKLTHVGFDNDGTFPVEEIDGYDGSYMDMNKDGTGNAVLKKGEGFIGLEGKIACEGGLIVLTCDYGEVYYFQYFTSGNTLVMTNGTMRLYFEK